jgi:hypothetical protein
MSEGQYPPERKCVVMVEDRGCGENKVNITYENNNKRNRSEFNNKA